MSFTPLANQILSEVVALAPYVNRLCALRAVEGTADDTNTAHPIVTGCCRRFTKFCHAGTNGLMTVSWPSNVRPFSKSSV